MSLLVGLIPKSIRRNVVLGSPNARLFVDTIKKAGFASQQAALETEAPVKQKKKAPSNVTVKIPPVDPSLLPPRRPHNGFARFVTESMRTNPPERTDARQNYFALFSQRWRALSDQERKQYSTTKHELEAHHAALEAWKANVDPQVFKAINAERVRKGKPKIPTPERLRTLAPNAYQLFTKAMFPVVVQEGALRGEKLIIKDTGPIVAERWRALSAEEKRVWIDKSESIQAEYNARAIKSAGESSQ